MARSTIRIDGLVGDFLVDQSASKVKELIGNAVDNKDRVITLHGRAEQRRAAIVADPGSLANATVNDTATHAQTEDTPKIGEEPVELRRAMAASDLSVTGKGVDVIGALQLAFDTGTTIHLRLRAATGGSTGEVIVLSPADFKVVLVLGKRLS